MKPNRNVASFWAAASMILAASVSCRTAAPAASPPPRVASKPPAPPTAGVGPVTRTPKEDCEELMNLVVPFAQKMLQERRAFAPFGAAMAPSGQIAGAMGGAGDEKPDVNQLISLLELGFHQGASEGKYKATAIVVDMVVIPPGKSAKQDGVAVRLDHREGYSVIVGFPYSFSDKGELVMEPPFATEGAHQIFPAR
jgi:hypothetical protein